MFRIVGIFKKNFGGRCVFEKNLWFFCRKKSCIKIFVHKLFFLGSSKKFSAVMRNIRKNSPFLTYFKSHLRVQSSFFFTKILKKHSFVTIVMWVKFFQELSLKRSSELLDLFYLCLRCLYSLFNLWKV